MIAMEMHTDMKSVLEAVERGAKGEAFQVGPIDAEKGSVLVVPEGKQVVDLRPYREPRLERPVRRKGVAQFTTLGSLIEHANRFRDEHSALFACDEPEKPSITAVLDYHEETAAGLPRFGEHRGHYAFPISEEWRFWTGISGKTLDQRAFAELLEDRITDVVEPGSVGEATRELALEIGIAPLAGRSALRTLSKGLTVHVDSKVVNKINLDSGEAQLLFSEQHNGEDGQPIKVPNGFVIAIPVCRGGQAYALPVRLRYRPGSGKVTWTMELHRADLAFREMFDEACTRARQETALPLFFGRPES